MHKDSDRVKRWRTEHPEKNAQYSKTYGEKHPEKLKECGRRYQAAHKKEINENGRKRRLKIRRETLSHYSDGTLSCACCGETHIEFLAIDHINGGGTKHRKELNRGGGIFAWLKKNGFPDGYRVLCHNCNQAIGLYGYCPHHNDTLVTVERKQPTLH